MAEGSIPSCIVSEEIKMSSLSSSDGSAISQDAPSASSSSWPLISPESFGSPGSENWDGETDNIDCPVSSASRAAKGLWAGAGLSPSYIPNLMVPSNSGFRVHWIFFFGCACPETLSLSMKALSSVRIFLIEMCQDVSTVSL
eukprot:CAMPEP_0184302858 /NCGR_PEP_ID=MMETSP1049-20130417/12731_1 /TAXON_ID=77928 /ORGANISM="Proteomonas sulcata, Strain CCMP704" /LENGTH=141 /DNA_ID=CAMNT_0026614247 /DNA_START=154 /DNA_END=579 /DNA_ORIENTATION=-